VKKQMGVGINKVVSDPGYFYESARSIFNFLL
jgi:hypothetical protein